MNPSVTAADRAKPTDQGFVSRRVIARPRLTSLLDAAPAHVIVLVGPAGYGKTTLAQQWITAEGRRGVWYRGGPASVDVAALLSGVARAMDQEVPGVTARLLERLRAVTRPEDHTSALTIVLAEFLEAWPSEAWLVIDDYQFLMPSPGAERVIEFLSEDQRLNMLVTSRNRPTWATPRRLLYGEVYELARTALALTLDEASEVVGREQRDDLPGLLALTEGWPAVIGLAALAVDTTVGIENPLPESLYQFFAEELFRVADDQTQAGLCELSLMPNLRVSEASCVLGIDGDRILDQAERLGFLSRDREEAFELHPLLRAFLRKKLEASQEAWQSAVSKVIPFLIETARWDEAYALISDYELAAEFSSLIDAGLYRLLEAGRIATIERWIATAHTLKLVSPLVELMEAEVLFRSANWTEAERLCHRAATDLPPESNIKSRAFFRAGQSAQLADRHESALEHHKRARDAAQSADDLSQALWGMFITQSELEQSGDAGRTLAEFDEARTSRTEDELRSISGRITLASTVGGLREATRPLSAVAHLVGRPCDPVVRCGFLQTLGSGLNLVARYSEALEAVVLEIEEARTYGLSFVLPHGYCNDAVAHLGLRQFRNCEAALLAAETCDGEKGLHIEMNGRAIRARMRLVQGRPEEAIELTQPMDWTRKAAPGMAGDYLATHALALACVGDLTAASRVIQDALATSRQVESRMLSAAAAAVVAIRGGGNFERAIRHLLEDMDITGNLDAVICGYRSYPKLLLALETHGSREIVLSLLRHREDERLARKLGLTLRDQPTRSILSPREREVLELLRRGMSNREIARTLWISEPTAKVHVRNILRKLEVRSRTEAALAAERDYADMTAIDNDSAADS